MKWVQGPLTETLSEFASRRKGYGIRRTVEVVTSVVTPGPRRASGSDLPRLAATVWSLARVVVLALLLVAGRHGFHGDKFYFVVTGRHLQVAAPDNPMLVPHLAAGWYRLVSGHLWALRVLPALAAGAYVLLGALMARELSAAPRHQLAAAAAVAMTALTLAVGHLFSTTTFDMVTTAAAVWLFVEAMGPDSPPGSSRRPRGVWDVGALPRSTCRAAVEVLGV
jgi:dolichyl-phosphate-mannose-protein mannosyltransferase